MDQALCFRRGVVHLSWRTASLYESVRNLSQRQDFEKWNTFFRHMPVHTGEWDDVFQTLQFPYDERPVCCFL
jgi:hypothetical protein